MKTITKEEVIKVRQGSIVVDMFDCDGERLPVEGNAKVVEKTIKRGTKNGRD